MRLNLSEVQNITTGMRESTREWMQDDDNFFSVDRTVRLVHTPDRGWQLTDGRHRLEESQRRGYWYIEASYEKWDVDGYVMEKGSAMVII